MRPSSTSVQPLRRDVPHLPPLQRPLDSEHYNPSAGWVSRKHYLSKQQLWGRILAEAVVDAASEPVLATSLHSSLLRHPSLEAALSCLLANKLADDKLLGSVQLMSLFQEGYAADPGLVEAAMADLYAVLDRDPACSKSVRSSHNTLQHCLAANKGSVPQVWLAAGAVQVQPVPAQLQGLPGDTVLPANTLAVECGAPVDIHPAAQLGRGVMLDHATGIVIGETAVVGDNVSMLHQVSLGGSGTGTGGLSAGPSGQPGVGKLEFW
ncbi:SATase_N domain-containing protein, partial [Haematococcus lacustris]